MHNFPANARLIQLHESSKEPATTHGHLSGESQETFVATNANIGMVLGDERASYFVAIDVDYPDASLSRELKQRVETVPTRLVETPHGWQAIYACPPGFPRLRARLDGKEGRSPGELLSHGYVVGPGATVRCDGRKHGSGISCGDRTYKLLCDAEPAPAPEWVVALANDLQRRKAAPTETSPFDAAERAGIPFGAHDKAGADLAYNLRKWLGLSEEGIRRYFAEGGLEGLISCLEGYNSASPFTQADAERWARSAARATGSGAIALPSCLTDNYVVEEEDKSYESATFVGATLKWWLRGFVPQGHFLTLYGDGGTGKSSWGSWLVARITERGANCATFSVEENADMFVARAVLDGADRDRIFSVNNASDWAFPKDRERLAAYIARRELKFIWLDSLYSHFEHLDGMNASTLARRILGPLEELARETDCTIMGVFHENKGGGYLGATEIKNVSRVFLHATRKTAGLNAPLVIKATKTNMPFKPDRFLNFKTKRVTLCDPISGEVQMEETEPGIVAPLEVQIAERVADTSRADEELEAILEEAAKAEPEGGKKRFDSV